MALRTLLRQLQSKAPPLARRISGDSSEGVRQLWSSESKATLRAPVLSGRNASSARNAYANSVLLQRGYSCETLSGDGREDGGTKAKGGESSRILEMKTTPNEKAADGSASVNLGPKVSERHNMAMIFTCTVCQTRSAKTMSRDTYEKGVVIVRCGGCKKLHLIADRLGWFGEPGSVEDFLKEKGVEVRKGSEESYEFSVEDLAGWSPPPAKE